MKNTPLAVGSPQPEDIERIQKEIHRPDTELIRKQIEFLKLFDPDFISSPHFPYGKGQKD